MLIVVEPMVGFSRCGVLKVPHLVDKTTNIENFVIIKCLSPPPNSQVSILSKCCVSTRIQYWSWFCVILHGSNRAPLCYGYAHMMSCLFSPFSRCAPHWQLMSWRFWKLKLAIPTSRELKQLLLCARTGNHCYGMTRFAALSHRCDGLWQKFKVHPRWVRKVKLRPPSSSCRQATLPIYDTIISLSWSRRSAGSRPCIYKPGLRPVSRSKNVSEALSLAATGADARFFPHWTVIYVGTAYNIV